MASKATVTRKLNAAGHQKSEKYRGRICTMSSSGFETLTVGGKVRVEYVHGRIVNRERGEAIELRYLEDYAATLRAAGIDVEVREETGEFGGKQRFVAIL